jgi:hypothetical protein
MFILDLIICLQSSDGKKVCTYKTLPILESYKMTSVQWQCCILCTKAQVVIFWVLFHDAVTFWDFIALAIWMGEYVTLVEQYTQGTSEELNLSQCHSVHHMGWPWIEPETQWQEASDRPPQPCHGISSCKI